MTPDFDRTPPARGGVLLSIAPRIRRIIANNPSAFTFSGTCTYVVGRGTVSVIDPGPDDTTHIDTLLDSLRGEVVTHILVTHTHRDHSPGARLLAERTGAPIIGCAPHRASREAHIGESQRLEASSDVDHAPERVLVDGDILEAGDHRFRAIETPGHTANHLMFELEGTGMVFSGDHVMAWSTTIVAPPDGAMGAYMESLDKLTRREGDLAYWPGHGGPVTDPRRFTRALLQHRRQREAQILDKLALGPAIIPEIVAANYPGLDHRLVGAACLSVFAHLEELIARGAVSAEPPVTLSSVFARA
ncbi:MAG: MBL fold metallo-hydrolase [Proteobacteria bacterium]|nr:MBL fold metallo-hydrolase [Pseudomonadota bacterium]